MQARAAARAVVDLARGMLMERLRCSPAEAQAQLAHLSAESGTSLTELAAQITGSQAQPGLVRDPGERDAPDSPEAAMPGTHRVALAGAAAEAAHDGGGVAAAVLEEALAPAGAVAVALWLAEPDGGLELAGQAGFSARDASRWRRIHPDMDTPAQRAADEGAEYWWPAGRADAALVPLIGDWPHGARAVLPLPGPGTTLGAMEICWPGPLEEFPDPLRRHISALTDVCAQALGTRLPSGDLAADHRASWAFSLLDSLVSSALFATALRDGTGAVTDFRISYLSKGFADPAGREAADLTGRPLLEVYPAAALSGGLYDRAVQVLATGQAQYTSGEIIAAPVAGGLATPVLEVRIARLYDGVVISWRPAGEVERLGALLHQAQRLGRIGGWEENLLTGEVLWTEPTFALFGQPPGDPVPVAKLHAHVPAGRPAGGGQFPRHAAGGQAGGRRRVPDHPGRRRERAADARVRRAGHRPGRHAGRGARRLPGRVRGLPHPGGVRRDPGPAGRHRGAGGGGTPAGAAVAAGHHPAGRGTGGDRRPGHRRPLPARRAREPGQRGLVRHGPAAE